MDIIEQCLKSAVSLLQYDNVKQSIDYNSIIDIIDQNAIQTETLTTLISAGKKILIIIDDDIDLKLLDQILISTDLTKTELILATYARSIVTEDSYKKVLGLELLLKYQKIVITYDINDHSQFDFFGTTSNKQPIFIHKSFLLADIAITISNLKPDIFYGYKGSRSSIFHGIANKKAISRISTLILDSSHNKDILFTDNYYHGSADNKVISDSIAATLIARSEIEYFSINYITNTDNQITDIRSGDIFLSQLDLIKEAQKYATDIDTSNLYKGAIIKLSNKYTSLSDYATAIFSALKLVAKGCRVVIDAREITDFGSEVFISKFNISSIETVKDELLSEFDYDTLSAAIIKYLSNIYHIAILSNINDNEIIQSGLNTISLAEIEVFLSNSTNILGIKDVERFAIR